MKTDVRFFWFFVVIALVALMFMFTQGCGSTEHRREQLQQEHPECFVMTDLTIECPNPFDDSSAGFGTEVKNQKIKTKGKKKNVRGAE